MLDYQGKLSLTVLRKQIIFKTILMAAVIWGVAANILLHAQYIQDIQWSGLKGTFDFEYGAVYGTKGMPDTGNRPGARRRSISWVDNDSAFFFFGGKGYDILGRGKSLNDLWKYNPATKEYTWIKGENEGDQIGIYGIQGIPGEFNTPGSREGSASWKTADGTTYVFGGNNLGTSFNDLWKYEHTSNYWTWLKGSNLQNQPGTYGTQGIPDLLNTPGARWGSVSWISDDGSLYLFGGEGYYIKHNDLWKYDPATNQWTWFKGANTPNELGIYGTQGVPDPANTPGARRSAVSWIHTDGCLYLFGGFGFDSTGTEGRLNDLWKYDPGSNQWTWIKGDNICDQSGTYGIQGVPNPLNNPCARNDAMSWITPGGTVYLFGGEAYDFFGIKNDLWKYDTGTNQWTWLKGSMDFFIDGIYGTQGVPSPPNNPGSRLGSFGWTGVDGMIYLFGGWGLDGAEGWRGLGLLNDLWRYNPATNQWTWIQGTDTRNQHGIYGVQGIPDSGNAPGMRKGAMSFMGEDSCLYLFGGWGDAIQPGTGDLSDLWKYHSATNQWTWIKGSNTQNNRGIYGIQLTPHPDNNPGARRESSCWTDYDGYLYLFGGKGSGSVEYGELNDLWRYNPATNEWTWLKGADTVNEPGIYGTQGIAHPANTPGGRSRAVAWSGLYDDVYLFGGFGRDGTGTEGQLNDLWRYDRAMNGWTWLKGADITNQWGVYGTQGIPDPANTPGARQGAVSWRNPDGILYLFGGFGYDITGVIGELNDLWKYNPKTNQWTWLTGSNKVRKYGIYGTQGQPGSNLSPGARQEALVWIGVDEMLYLFGGMGYDSEGVRGLLNDLWQYNPARHEWIWLKGSKTINQRGYCEIQGIFDPVNIPGARQESVSWCSQDGMLFLFGGDGLDCGSYQTDLGELWKTTALHPLSASSPWFCYD